MRVLDPSEALDLVPHPLVIVTAGDPAKPRRRGGMAAAWFARVSWDPPMVAVAMTRTRYTYELIREFGSFAVHLVSRSLEEVALEVFGSLSGRDVDKFERSGIAPLRAESIVAPIIPGAPVVLECKLVAEYEAGDHVIVVGEVVKAYRGSDEPPMVWVGSSAIELGGSDPPSLS